MTQRKGGKKPVISNEERALLQSIIVDTVESLNLPALITVAVREHLKLGNPPEQSYASAVPSYGAQGVGTQAQPSTPPVQEDPISYARKAVSVAWGNLGKARDEWYKARATLEKASPLGPEYNNAVVNMDSVVHTMLGSAEQYRAVVTGIVFG